MKNRFLVLFAFVALLATQSPAAIKATLTRGNAFGANDGASHLVPLNDKDSTVFNFATAKPNQLLLISYNAECSVDNARTTTWLHVEILVDGVAQPPSDDDNAFCSGHGVTAGGNWVSAITTAVVTVPTTGQHRLQVRATLVGTSGGEGWDLDDSILTITN